MHCRAAVLWLTYVCMHVLAGPCWRSAPGSSFVWSSSGFVSAVNSSVSLVDCDVSVVCMRLGVSVLLSDYQAVYDNFTSGNAAARVRQEVRAIVVSDLKLTAREVHVVDHQMTAVLMDEADPDSDSTLTSDSILAILADRGDEASFDKSVELVESGGSSSRLHDLDPDFTAQLYGLAQKDYEAMQEDDSTVAWVVLAIVITVLLGGFAAFAIFWRRKTSRRHDDAVTRRATLAERRKTLLMQRQSVISASGILKKNNASDNVILDYTVNVNDSEATGEGSGDGAQDAKHAAAEGEGKCEGKVEDSKAGGGLDESQSRSRSQSPSRPPLQSPSNLSAPSDSESSDQSGDDDEEDDSANDDTTTTRLPGMINIPSELENQYLSETSISRKSLLESETSMATENESDDEESGSSSGDDNDGVSAKNDLPASSKSSEDDEEEEDDSHNEKSFAASENGAVTVNDSQLVDADDMEEVSDVMTDGRSAVITVVKTPIGRQTGSARALKRQTMGWADETEKGMQANEAHIIREEAERFFDDTSSDGGEVSRNAPRKLPRNTEVYFDDIDREFGGNASPNKRNTAQLMDDIAKDHGHDENNDGSFAEEKEKESIREEAKRTHDDASTSGSLMRMDNAEPKAKRDTVMYNRDTLQQITMEAEQVETYKRLLAGENAVDLDVSSTDDFDRHARAAPVPQELSAPECSTIQFIDIADAYMGESNDITAAKKKKKKKKKKKESGDNDPPPEMLSFAARASEGGEGEAKPRKKKPAPKKRRDTVYMVEHTAAVLFGDDSKLASLREQYSTDSEEL